MEYTIISYHGVPPILYGMTVEEVRKGLNEPFETFKKDPSAMFIDAFRGHTIHVFYKEDRTCEAIELFPPANPKLEGQELMGRPFLEVSAWFRKMDPEVQIHSSGLISRKFGVSLYAPAAEKEPQEPVEAVLGFALGYYD